MENSAERRIQNAIISLMQNESLMEGLETEAASALLAWASQCVADIYNEIGDQDDISVEIAAYPRLRAVRQMMRVASLLATGQYGSEPAACSGALDRILIQASLVYGARMPLPEQARRMDFLSTPVANTGQWISALRNWLETSST